MGVSTATWTFFVVVKRENGGNFIRLHYKKLAHCLYFLDVDILTSPHLTRHYSCLFFILAQAHTAGKIWLPKIVYLWASSWVGLSRVDFSNCLAWVQLYKDIVLPSWLGPHWNGFVDYYDFGHPDWEIFFWGLERTMWGLKYWAEPVSLLIQAMLGY